MVYDSLDNALFKKDEKFKTTRLKNPDYNIEKYNLYGFTSGVQRFAVNMGRENEEQDSLHRAMEAYGEDVLQTLEPNSKESSRKYWLTVKDYMPSILDWVHKHQPSINAMPFYGDVSGESVQVFTEVPSGVSMFGHAYIPSYVYNSPYMIPPLRRRKNVQPIP
ncbi:hypothetical protein CUMW_133330 [Citrus unshiu]|nr:hypothetical protein CUMW_133330 [Citrus unshiu]